ncbi:hypothetical protein XANCAGTX0491_004835 [Xanthoria calcicola]
MMHLISIHRSFGAFLVLLVSAILVSTWHHGTTSPLAKRQPLAKTTNTSPLGSSSAAVAARVLGVHDDQFNLSATDLSHVLTKRERTLTFNAAWCTGYQLNYKVIQEALAGTRAPAKDYGEDDIKNGWSKEPLFRSIPAGFDEAFKAIGKNVFPDIGERVPTFQETVGINLVQDIPFLNSAGKKQDPIPPRNNLQAHYECFYIPKWHAIISTDSRSPKYMLPALQKNPSALAKRIPPLNRQSDVLWAVWKSTTPFPADLRYIGRDIITNDDTRGVMNDIFAQGPTGKPLLWPGVSFDIDTKEGQALLGTPNGLATAYILADRAAAMGRRSISVRIWAAETEPLNQGYRMLFDMAPRAAGPELPPPSLPPLPSFEPIVLTERGVGREARPTPMVIPLQTV